ncbi:MAG: succinylglutamate desuccinylase/aspartoacylase family protein [Acetobacteraceae bacterium]|jgi:predicted deacylase|nr:succinylglutamate desuccinylase/aspartoacylase family protein [Acetobacteraceae bacterium]
MPSSSVWAIALQHDRKPPPAMAAPPGFPVAITPPAMEAIAAGNSGIAGVWSFASATAGPHSAIVSLVHGNEFAGALALMRLMGALPAPARGRLSLVFANLSAFARFDAREPTVSRYVDEDLNRVWCRGVLDGARDSVELRRARELRPLFDTVDHLLDLHSMLWDSDPLILCGPTEKARRLAVAIGTPPLVVSDQGHAGGRRLIDYRPFVDPGTKRAAVLVEAGQHWEAATVPAMLASVSGFLRHTGQIGEAEAAALTKPRAVPPHVLAPVIAEVTQTVTAESSDFRFVRNFRGGEVVRERNTLIALDGNAEIRTPHDDCILVMPSPRTCRGHTAVRLARRIGA